MGASLLAKGRKAAPFRGSELQAEAHGHRVVAAFAGQLAGVTQAQLALLADAQVHARLDHRSILGNRYARVAEPGAALDEAQVGIRLGIAEGMPPADAAARGEGRAVVQGERLADPQAHGGEHHVLLGAGFQAPCPAFFTRLVAVVVDVGQTGERLQRHAVGIDGVAHFAEHLGGTRLVAGLQAVVVVAGLDVTLAVDVVPGVTRTKTGGEGVHLVAQVGRQVVAVHRRILALALGADAAVGVTGGDTGAPLVVEVVVEADQETGQVAIDVGRIVAAIEITPAAHGTDPAHALAAATTTGGLLVAARGQRVARILLIAATGLAHAVVDRIADVARVLDQHGSGAGVDLAGQAFEGRHGIAGSGADHRVVQAGGRRGAFQGCRDAPLVGSARDAGEGRAVARHIQGHGVGAVVQRGVEERQLLQAGVGEGAGDAAGGREQGVLGRPRVRTEVGHAQRATQVRRTANVEVVGQARRQGDRQGAGVAEVARHRQVAAVGAGQHGAVVDQRTDAAGTGQGGIGRDGDLGAEHSTRVGRVADGQGALVQGEGAVERLAADDQQIAAALLGDAAGASEDAAELTAAALVEHQVGVVGDIALQAGGVALQGTATDGGAAGVGVGAGQDQGAGVEFLDTAAAGQRRGDGRGAGADTDGRQAAAGRVHRDQAARGAGVQLITVIEELQAGEGLLPFHGDLARRAGWPAEHRELAAPGSAAGAGGVGPVGAGRVPHAVAATDGAIGGGLAAVPELQGIAAADHQVDLVGNGGLQGQVRRQHARRQGAVDQTVVGDAAAVGEQLIDAHAEAAGIAEVQRAVEDQVAIHRDQGGGGARRTEGVVEDAARGQVEVAHGQRRGRRAGIQAGAIGDGDGAAVGAAAAEAGAAFDQHVGAGQGAIVDQAAGADQGVAGEVAVASEKQAAKTELSQGARAAQVAAVGAVGILLEDQRAVVGDCALQAIGIAGHAAGVDGGAAAVVVDAGEPQRAIAVLDQAAGAGDDAVEGGVVAAGQGQLRQQADAVGQLQGARAVEQGIAAHAQAAAAQGAVIAQGQAAAVEHGAAAIGVDAVQGQVGAAVLGQAASAADHAIEGQGIAAADAQAAVEHGVVGQGHGGVAVQEGAGRSGQVAAAQGCVVAHHQGAAIECGTAGVAVGCVEHQGAAVDLGQGPGAVDGDAQGPGAARIDPQVGGAGAGQQLAADAAVEGVAVTDELQAGDGMAAIDGDGAAGALEHREGVVPGLVERAVGRGPVGVGGVPDTEATFDRAVAGSLATIPEQHGAVAADHQVDFVAHRSLHQHVIGVDRARQGVDGQAVVGQAAAVERQSVDTGTEAADVGDVEVAVQGQVASHAQQRRIARQRHAEGSVEVGVAVQHQRADIQGIAALQVQVAAADHAHRAGEIAAAGENGVVADTDAAAGQAAVDHQAAIADGGRAGVAVAAGQGQGAAAGLVQDAATAEVAGEGTATHRQGVAALDFDVASAAQVAEGQAAAQVEVGAVAQVDLRRVAQGAAAGGAEGTGEDVEDTGEGVVAAEGQVVQAVLVQGAIAAEHAVEGQVVVAGHRQGAADVDVVAQGQGAGAGQLRGAGDAQLAAAQCQGIAQGQVAAVDGQAADEGVGTIQRQAGETVLDQAAIAADHTVEGQVVAAIQGQFRTRNAQQHVIGHGQGTAGIQLGGTADDQAATAQRAGIAQAQLAGVEVEAAAEGIHAIQGQGAGTLLGQAADAIDRTAQSQVVAAEVEQVAVEVDGIADGHRAEGVQRGAVGRGQGASAERVIGAQHQATGAEGGTAQVGVGVAQGEDAIARLEQAAVATDHAVEGQVIAAGQGQRPGGAERVAQGHRLVAVQRGAGGGAQGAGAHGAVAAQHEGAVAQGGAAGVAVEAVEHQGADVQFVQGTVAGQGQVEGCSDAGIGTHGEVGAVAVGEVQRAVGTRNQLVAVGHELHAGGGLRAIDGDRAGRALEHRELVQPVVVAVAVELDPVVGGAVPGPAATFDQTVVAGVAAVPELHQQVGREHHHVDLAVGGLEGQVDNGGAIGHVAEGHALVAQDAAVVEQTVDAVAEGTGVVDVERARQDHVAADVEQRGAAGKRRAQVDVGDAVRRQHQVAHLQDLPGGTYQMTAIGDGGGAVDGAATGHARTGGDVQAGTAGWAEGAGDIQGTGGDLVQRAVGAVAGQGQGSAANLVQAAVTGHLAVEHAVGVVATKGQHGVDGQVGDTRAGQAADRQVAAGVQHGAGRQVGGGQAAQGAGVHRGDIATEQVQVAIERVVAEQQQFVVAGLVEGAAAADLAEAGERVVGCDGQLAVDRDVVEHVARLVGDQGGRGIGDDGAGAQRSVVAQHYRAAIERGAAAVGVGAVQGQGAAAGLVQAGAAADSATQGQVVGTGDGQAAVQGDVVAQGHAVVGRGQDGRAADGQATGTQRAVLANGQGAGVEHGAVGVGVAAKQGQGAQAVLDQAAAAATEGAGQGQVGAAAHGQHAEQAEVVGQGNRCVAVEARSAGSDAASAEGGVAASGGVAAEQEGIAAVGVVAGQEQIAGAGLGQVAGAVDHAVERQVLRTVQGQGAEQVHGVVQVGRDGVVEQAAGCGQGATAQAVGRGQDQGAGIQAHATAEGVVAAQGQAGQTALEQAAGTADVAVQGQVVAAAQGQGVATQGDRVGHGDAAVVGRVEEGPGAADVQGAAAQRVVAAQQQGAVCQAGTAAVVAGAIEGQGARTGLQQRAAAGDGATQGDVVAAVEGQQRAKVDGVAQVEGGGAGQGRGATDIQDTATDRRIVADGQGAAVQIGWPGVGVDTGQDQVARAVLGQAARTVHHAGQGQVGTAGKVEVAAQVERIAQQGRTQHVEGHAIGGVEAARAQRGIAAKHQGAAVQRGIAGVAIVAAEGQHARAVLDQAAGAIEGAGEGQVVVAEDAQATEQGHVVGQAECSAAVQRGAVGGGQVAGAQGGVAAQHQGTAGEAGRALIAVVAVEGEHAAAGLVQAAESIDHAIQGEVGGARQAQVGAKVDGIAQGHGAAAVQAGGAGDVQSATAQCPAVAEGQGAGGQGGAAAIGVETVEGQVACAVLDQAAGAADDTAEGQVAAAEQGQAVAQVDGVGQGQRRIVVQADAATGHVQGPAAQRRVVAQHQGAGIDRGAAGVAVGAVQGQGAGAVFHQAAAAADLAIEGQGIAAGQVEHAEGADVVGQGDRGIAVQGGVGRGHQGAVAQRGIIAEHQGAAVEQGAAGVAVGAVEHQGAGVDLVQHAAAGQADVEGRGGARVDAEGRVAGAVVDQLQGARAIEHIAIDGELHTGEDLGTADRDGAGRGLEHREVAAPVAVAGAVDRGPVAAQGIPGAAAALDHAVADGVAAVPEQHAAIGAAHQQVDLGADRGLQLQIARQDAARHCADYQAVVGERPGVVDQAVDTGAEAADIADVQVAVEGQVAAHREQRAAAGGRRA